MPADSSSPLDPVSVESLKQILKDPHLELSADRRAQLTEQMFRKFAQKKTGQLCNLFAVPVIAELFIAARDEKQRTPVLLAAELGLENLLDTLLRVQTVDMSVTDEQGNNALHLSATNGHARCVTLLLADGRIDINTRNPKGHSPLDLAQAAGREIVAAQLRARAESQAAPVVRADLPNIGITPGGNTRLTFLSVFKSGGEYLPEHALRLQKQIAEHYTLPHRFYCLSDKPLSCPWVQLEHDWPRWWPKLELFRHDFGPVVYFDLDTTITGNLDYLAAAPDRFSMINDFYMPQTMNSGMMAWTGDQYRHLADAFNPEKDASRYADWFLGDGAWIRERVAEKASLQERFPGEIVSFKVSGHSYPKDASVVCFHGLPRPWEVAPPASPSIP